MIRVAHPTRPAPAGDGPLLAVDSIRAAYGAIEAVQGVSLTVARGEVVALIGANGAGKSTTLRCIVGLVPLTAGRILLAGRDMASDATWDRVRAGVALVPEGRAIFPALTVRENLDLGAYGHRDPRAMAETTDDVVGLFPRLGERMRQRAGTLSGGEQQMLAIGRALMGRPSLLLLDEPSLGIAPKVVAQIAQAVRAVAASGVTILLVEQNTRLALETSSRAYVLRAGRVALEGKSADLAVSAEVRDAYLGG